MRHKWIRWALIPTVLLALGAIAVVLLLQHPSVQDELVKLAARQILDRHQEDLFKDDAMRAVVCGSSSPAPMPHVAKACIAVIAGGKLYIVDSGPQSTANLVTWRVPIERLSGVFITHFHSDHIGDLGELNFNSWNLGRAAPLNIFGPPGVERVVDGFATAYALDTGYRVAHHSDAFMSAPMSRMIAHPIALDGAATLARDRTAIAVRDGDLTITAIEVNHAPVEPAYGYRFDYKGRSIVISGDTAPHPPLARAARAADVLFHEAQAKHMVDLIAGVARDGGNARLAKIIDDTQRYHTSPIEAAELANEAGVSLLVYFHYTPPMLNFLTKMIFFRGVNEVRPTGWLASQDGTVIELPFGSRAINVKSIAP